MPGCAIVARIKKSQELQQCRGVGDGDQRFPRSALVSLTSSVALAYHRNTYYEKDFKIPALK